MADPVSDYCDYLDKEMTIMGLLTAFAVAVPALVLDHVAGAKPSEQPIMYEMWQYEQVVLAAGSLVFFSSALSFYLQRSALAYYLGQLRLSLTAAYHQTSSDPILAGTSRLLVCLALVQRRLRPAHFGVCTLWLCPLRTQHCYSLPA